MIQVWLSNNVICDDKFLFLQKVFFFFFFLNFADNNAALIFEGVYWSGFLSVIFFIWILLPTLYIVLIILTECHLTK